MKTGHTFGLWGPAPGAARRVLLALSGLAGGLALASCAHCPEHGGGCCAPTRTTTTQQVGPRTSDTSKVVYPVADTRQPLEGARVEVRETPVYQAPSHRSSDFPRYR